MRQFFYANDFLFLKNKKHNSKYGIVEIIILKLKLTIPTIRNKSTTVVKAKIPIKFSLELKFLKIIASKIEICEMNPINIIGCEKFCKN